MYFARRSASSLSAAADSAADTCRPRKAKKVKKSDEDEAQDAALLEEMEDFVLEDMARVLGLFEKDHPLLIAVSSVRELGVRTAAWDAMG